MTVEKMGELIKKWEKEKEEYDLRMEEKIEKTKKERDEQLALQARHAFEKNKVDVSEFSRLRYASKEQLLRVMEFIQNEIQPEKGQEKEKDKGQEHQEKNQGNDMEKEEYHEGNEIAHEGI